jgi:arabinogalactan endo-1,4-beta-galactosidase
MSLIGTYVNVAQNYKLVITAANDANGQGTGVMHWGPHAIPVTIHYHFENNVGPVTNLNIWGSQDNPNKYLTGSGATNNQGYKSIEMGISLATDARVDTFHTRLDLQ